MQSRRKMQSRPASGTPSHLPYTGVDGDRLGLFGDGMVGFIGRIWRPGFCRRWPRGGVFFRREREVYPIYSARGWRTKLIVYPIFFSKGERERRTQNSPTLTPFPATTTDGTPSTYCKNPLLLCCFKEIRERVRDVWRCCGISLGQPQTACTLHAKLIMLS